MAWGKHGLTRTIKIPLDRDNRLIQLCSETGKTPNYLINRAIEFSLNSAEFSGRVKRGFELKEVSG
jgi:predicted DNA-binding protein